jgi:hypothetical protein
LSFLQDNYALTLTKNDQSLKFRIKANDSNHAQAQALDIRRAFQADSVVISYGDGKYTDVAELFERLAFNQFEYKECFTWKGKHLNNCPCIYVLKSRFYIRPLILNYLDIPDSSAVKMTCKDPLCVNPYHFSYVRSPNAKLSSGDTSLVLAYHRQGTSVKQIAKALNVHRSTIYRTIKNECLSSGSSNHSYS